MNVLAKLKLALAIRQPAQAVAGNLKTIKTGYKTLAFWITFVGSLLSLAAAAKGFMPPQYSLIVTTALVTIYNILRGLAKADSAVTTKPFWATTETWMGVLGQVSAGILALQQGGVNAKWETTAATVIAAAMTLSRDLRALDPQDVQKTVAATSSSTTK
jgi:hypothetical protein